MQKYYTINSLLVDAYFKDFLVSTQNKINKMILCVDTKIDINFISPSDKSDMISYLPKNKRAKVLDAGIDPFSNEADRSRMKVGRLVQKLFTDEVLKEFEVSIKDVENFVNAYKSFFDNDRIEMKVVSGKDVKKWYLADNYALPENGTLWKSCMRYKEKQAFLELYIKNPETVKMLVMLEDDEDGVKKVRARALLWEDVKSSSSSLKVMDRIYSIYDSDVFVFKNWAREHGYICKTYQNAKSQTLFDVGEDVLNLNLSVELENSKLEWYPYLDTFQFYNISTGTLFNFPSSDYVYQLNRANGLLEDEPEETNHDDEDDEFVPIRRRTSMALNNLRSRHSVPTSDALMNYMNEFAAQVAMGLNSNMRNSSESISEQSPD